MSPLHCNTHHVTLFPLQLTTVHNQMHSKGGYDHSSHVPVEATPSGHDISIRVVSYDIIKLGNTLNCMYINVYLYLHNVCTLELDA